MLHKAEGRWERWQVQGWKRTWSEWSLGRNEFIQGGVGAHGKSAMLFGQGFASTESMLPKHLSMGERKREISTMKSGVGAVGHF